MKRKKKKNQFQNQEVAFIRVRLLHETMILQEGKDDLQAWTLIVPHSLPMSENILTLPAKDIVKIITSPSIPKVADGTKTINPQKNCGKEAKDEIIN